MGTGSDVNLLETIYISVDLPVDPRLYTPWMGVRVREAKRALPLPLPIGDDPIMGITSIDLLQEMPEEQKKIKKEKEEREAKMNDEAAEREAEREAKIAAGGDVEEVSHPRPSHPAAFHDASTCRLRAARLPTSPPPTFLARTPALPFDRAPSLSTEPSATRADQEEIAKLPNEEVLDELFLSSAARNISAIKMAGKNGKEMPEPVRLRTAEIPQDRRAHRLTPITAPWPPPVTHMTAALGLTRPWLRFMLACTGWHAHDRDAGDDRTAGRRRGGGGGGGRRPV